VPFPWTVAIVDDDRQARLSLSSLMRSYGIKVEVFASAKSFLSSPQLATFDCVITDLHMPKMNGLEMIEEMRRLRGPAPVIAISAFEEERARAAGEGVDVFLPKPVDANLLLTSMRRLLGNGDAPID